tara:strand:+ start:12913 stop:16947 length:4035 start_codon:yes stop_codon:yes gene_type:complete
MLKQQAQYRGMSKDLSSDKQGDKYFDAKNIRILATDQKSTFSITNEAGNEFIFSIPSPTIDTNSTSIRYDTGSLIKTLKYQTETSVIPRCSIEKEYDQRTSGTQVIIGTKEMRDSALIVTTDDNGFDCFWELTNLNEGDFDLNLLYMGNLGLSKINLVQVLYNYENSIIQKIYFVDGQHQLRFLNIRQSVANGDSINLVDLDPSAVDVVSNFDLSQIKITGVVGGGSHTAGMIQYSYGLYILNGAQTTPSPLSELVAIDKGTGLGGGEVNEVLGKSISLEISNIDQKFTHIKIYSIKYTSYNENPEITIVADKEIDTFTSFSFTDDGLSGTSISLDAFIFLGSNPIIPKHIATKDNRLFPINIVEQPFDVELDCRAFSFNSSTDCVVYNNTYIDSNRNVTGDATVVDKNSYSLPEGHDSINSNYDLYKYKSNGSTLGASGKYIEVEVVQSSLSDSQSESLQFLKDRELYRLGIKFYNRLGQTSDPKWIMDLKAPAGNLSGNYNQLKITLTADFYTWLGDSSNFSNENDIPVGYKILRADRTLTDQTIYAQGFINPMVANYVTKNKLTSLQDRKDAVNSTTSDIIPSMTRMFESMSPFIGCKDYYDLSAKSSVNSALTYGRDTEGFKPPSSKDWRAQNFQHSRLMQFFSPDVLFRDNQIDSSFKLRVLGLVEQDYVANWATETNPITAVHVVDAKFLDGVTSLTPGVTPQTRVSNPTYISDVGFFGPTNGENTHATHQVFRQFTGDFHEATGKTNYDIYGSPELTQEGADFTAYNNDYSLRYSNNLKSMLMDDWRKSDGVHGDSEVQIRGCNTIGAKCITFAEGPNDLNYPVDSRKSIEQIHTAANTGATKGVLLTEFVKDSSVFYIGGIYGGMTYEAKKNASYIEIGSLNDIDENNVLIESPGDTFVNVFTFTKLVKTETENTSVEFNTVSEIVSIKVETTVDLKNRNDLSLGAWDNRWQPKYDEYQDYNTVYSQQPTLIKSIDTGTKFKKIQEFDGRLMSSKEKIPGEFVDSWTDFLENETMDLDGKYGPINAVINLKDEIFCLQDTAVAHISINPRAQTTSNDGILLELGTGGILHDYKYKSTTIGCLNKWGAVTTENAFYFVDVINHGIMTFDGSAVGRISDLKGFHHELVNKMNYNDLSQDNPVLSTGVSVGYNSVNADVYFSFTQSEDSFTIGFNEKIGEFVTYYDYIPAWYINKGSVMISTDKNNTQVWEHFKGLPNHFYGQHFPSSITLHVAPQGGEIILNGASYKMELTDLSGNEVLNKGLTGVRVYNDYQDSGLVDLVQRQNVFKKFRNWKINFPRDNGSRDRVRSAWGFTEFSFDNLNGNKLILHDMTIFYTQP